jgi:hypothetical protein
MDATTVAIDLAKDILDLRNTERSSEPPPMLSPRGALLLCENGARSLSSMPRADRPETWKETAGTRCGPSLGNARETSSSIFQVCRRLTRPASVSWSRSMRCVTELAAGRGCGVRPGRARVLCYLGAGGTVFVIG